MVRRSVQPIASVARRARARLTLRGELLLAVLPTVTVLAVLGLVEAFSEQRLLFASLASSAFLIYLDPLHGTNSVRTLIASQLLAACVGMAAFVGVGPGYGGAAAAMVAAITLMIVLDVVHPPAVATALSFALRAGDASNLALFSLAVGLTATLVLLQQSALWVIARLTRRDVDAPAPPPEGAGPALPTRSSAARQ